MNSNPESPIRSAEVVLPCPELDPTLAFFTETLGFRINAIFPADSPKVAVISGHGVCLRLEPDVAGHPGTLRLACENPSELAGGASELVAPNGTRIEFVDANPPLVLPPEQQSFVLNRISGEASWQVGRAGMQYRDLIPDRQGGRFIASHILIAEGGDVPDYPHFHRIRFQLIYVRRGWVRVVYEDQGEPFVMRAGDCVVQPPQIRHQVLEASAGLEVVEITSPAEHLTTLVHDLTLPNRDGRPARAFDG